MTGWTIVQEIQKIQEKKHFSFQSKQEGLTLNFNLKK